MAIQPQLLNMCTLAQWVISADSRRALVACLTSASCPLFGGISSLCSGTRTFWAWTAAASARVVFISLGPTTYRAGLYNSSPMEPWPCRSSALPTNLYVHATDAGLIHLPKSDSVTLRTGRIFTENQFDCVRLILGQGMQYVACRSPQLPLRSLTHQLLILFLVHSFGIRM